MKLIILLMMMSITILGLKIEDNSNIKNDTDSKKSSENKDIIKKNPESKQKLEKSTLPVNNKNLKDNSIFTENKTVKKSDYILPKAEEMGRVFVIPSLSYNSSFSNTLSNFASFNSDFEYNTGVFNNTLSVYGNIGFGVINMNFLFHLGGGVKYNLPRLTRFMKPFFKLGVILNPYFSDNEFYIPSGIILGVGFKFFITNNFAFEESQDLQIGTDINTSNTYFVLRFKFGVIFIF